ncbi:MAG: SGNH/GDSL hydrolase family protein [Proteobacteria bacterium]|nr:SGNH/GDSL hydrolase family protein [Pseudomonadota bacterium]
MVRILKFILAPVLMFQGKQVKKNTPRLPEARGDRKGIQGNGEKQIRLLILGDSAAAGVGIDHQSAALSGQILACFGQAYRIEWELIAKTGTTTAMTLAYLKTVPPTVFDVVVTSLGVNDVKNGVAKNQWMTQQKNLIFLLREKFKIQRILIAAVPPMEVFPAFPWPLKWYLGVYAKHLNTAIRDWLKEQKDCEFLAFNLPLDTALMAEDKFHPGPLLHTIWGKEISRRIKLYFD